MLSQKMNILYTTDGSAVHRKGVFRYYADRLGKSVLATDLPFYFLFC